MPRASQINPATTSDPNWVPLWNTPNFPGYTSGHSTFSGAASTVLASIFGLASSSVLVVRAHRGVVWPVAARMLTSAAVGMPLGLVVLLAVDERLLRLIIAVAVVVFVGLLLAGVTVRGSGRGVDVAAGFVSGVLNTSVSTNGPPLVLVHGLAVQNSADQWLTNMDVLTKVRGQYLAASTTLLLGSPMALEGHRQARALLLSRRPIARTTTFFIYDFTHEADGPAERASR